MARPLRIEIAGGRYHVMARGNERRDIFRKESDYLHFLEILEELPARFGTSLHAYALMKNHYHLLLETAEANLSRACQWINLSYGAWFNRQHDRSGHLFQGRFKAHLIEADSGVMEVARYVHLNPVRIGRLGLGKERQAQQRTHAATATAPELIRERLQVLRGYRWTSYPAYVGQARCPEWLETGLVGRLCGGARAAQRARELQRYVEEPIREGVLDSPWERLIAGVVLGSQEFVEGLRDRIQGIRSEQTAMRALEKGRTWEVIVRAVEEVKGEKWAAFLDRRGDWGRDAALYLGQRCGRMSLVELGERAGGMNYAAVGAAISRFSRQLNSGPCKARLRRVEKTMSSIEI